jgi:hypothetical protein
MMTGKMDRYLPGDRGKCMKTSRLRKIPLEQEESSLSLS